MGNVPRGFNGQYEDQSLDRRIVKFLGDVGMASITAINQGVYNILLQSNENDINKKLSEGRTNNNPDAYTRLAFDTRADALAFEAEMKNRGIAITSCSANGQTLYEVDKNSIGVTERFQGQSELKDCNQRGYAETQKATGAFSTSNNSNLFRDFAYGCMSVPTSDSDINELKRNLHIFTGSPANPINTVLNIAESLAAYDVKNGGYGKDGLQKDDIHETAMRLPSGTVLMSDGTLAPPDVALAVREQYSKTMQAAQDTRDGNLSITDKLRRQVERDNLNADAANKILDANYKFEAVVENKFKSNLAFEESSYMTAMAELNTSQAMSKETTKALSSEEEKYLKAAGNGLTRRGGIDDVLINKFNAANDKQAFLNSLNESQRKQMMMLLSEYSRSNVAGLSNSAKKTILDIKHRKQVDAKKLESLAKELSNARDIRLSILDQHKTNDFLESGSQLARDLNKDFGIPLGKQLSLDEVKALNFKMAQKAAAVGGLTMTGKVDLKKIRATPAKDLGMTEAEKAWFLKVNGSPSAKTLTQAMRDAKKAKETLKKGISKINSRVEDEDLYEVSKNLGYCGKAATVVLSSAKYTVKSAGQLGKKVINKTGLNGAKKPINLKKAPAKPSAARQKLFEARNNVHTFGLKVSNVRKRVNQFTSGIKSWVGNLKIVKFFNGINGVKTAIENAKKKIIMGAATVVIKAVGVVAAFCVVYMVVGSFTNFVKNYRFKKFNSYAPETFQGTVAYNLYCQLKTQEDSWLKDLGNWDNAFNQQKEMLYGEDYQTFHDYVAGCQGLYEATEALGYDEEHRGLYINPFYTPLGTQITIGSRLSKNTDTEWTEWLSKLFPDPTDERFTDFDAELAYMTKVKTYDGASVTNIGTNDNVFSQTSGRTASGYISNIETGHTSNIKDIIAMTDVMYELNMDAFYDALKGADGASNPHAGILGSSPSQIDYAAGIGKKSSWSDYTQTEEYEEAEGWFETLAEWFKFKAKNEKGAAQTYDTIQKYAKDLFDMSHQEQWFLDVQYYNEHLKLDRANLKENPDPDSDGGTRGALGKYTPETVHPKIGSDGVEVTDQKIASHLGYCVNPLTNKFKLLYEYKDSDGSEGDKKIHVYAEGRTGTYFYVDEDLFPISIKYSNLSHYDTGGWKGLTSGDGSSGFYHACLQPFFKNWKATDRGADVYQVVLHDETEQKAVYDSPGHCKNSPYGPYPNDIPEYHIDLTGELTNWGTTIDGDCRWCWEYGGDQVSGEWETVIGGYTKADFNKSESAIKSEVKSWMQAHGYPVVRNEFTESDEAVYNSWKAAAHDYWINERHYTESDFNRLTENLMRSYLTQKLGLVVGSSDYNYYIDILDRKHNDVAAWETMYATEYQNYIDSYKATVQAWRDAAPASFDDAVEAEYSWQTGTSERYDEAYYGDSSYNHKDQWMPYQHLINWGDYYAWQTAKSCTDETKAPEYNLSDDMNTFTVTYYVPNKAGSFGLGSTFKPESDYTIKAYDSGVNSFEIDNGYNESLGNGKTTRFLESQAHFAGYNEDAPKYDGNFILGKPSLNIHLEDSDTFTPTYGWSDPSGDSMCIAMAQTADATIKTEPTATESHTRWSRSWELVQDEDGEWHETGNYTDTSYDADVVVETNVTHKVTCSFLRVQKFTKHTLTFHRTCKGHDFTYCGGHVGVHSHGTVYSTTNEQAAAAGVEDPDLMTRASDWTKAELKSAGLNKIIGKYDQKTLDKTPTGKSVTLAGFMSTGKTGLTPNNPQWSYSGQFGPNLLNESGGWAEDDASWGLLNSITKGSGTSGGGYAGSYTTSIPKKFSNFFQIVDGKVKPKLDSINLMRDIFDIDANMKYGCNVFPLRADYHKYKGWTEDNMSLVIGRVSAPWDELYGFDIPTEIGNHIAKTLDTSSPYSSSHLYNLEMSRDDIKKIDECLTVQYGSSYTKERQKAVHRALGWVGRGHTETYMGKDIWKMAEDGTYIKTTASHGYHNFLYQAETAENKYIIGRTYDAHGAPSGGIEFTVSTKGSCTSGTEFSFVNYLRYKATKTKTTEGKIAATELDWQSGSNQNVTKSYSNVYPADYIFTIRAASFKEMPTFGYTESDVTKISDDMGASDSGDIKFDIETLRYYAENSDTDSGSKYHYAVFIGYLTPDTLRTVAINHFGETGADKIYTGSYIKLSTGQNIVANTPIFVDMTTLGDYTYYSRALELMQNIEMGRVKQKDGTYVDADPVGLSKPNLPDDYQKADDMYNDSSLGSSKLVDFSGVIRYDSGKSMLDDTENYGTGSRTIGGIFFHSEKTDSYWIRKNKTQYMWTDPDNPFFFGNTKVKSFDGY